MPTSTQKKSEKKKANLTFRRFEFKYHIPKQIADRIIPQMLNYMDYDPYVDEKEYYEVNSLYMDSHDFKSYHEKVDGIMNRKKLRVRSYTKGYDNESNMFAEIKRKSGEAILKDRIIIKGGDFKSFLENPFNLLKTEEYHGSFLNEFLYEYTSNNMKPVVLVSYKRKPFFSKFDRRFRVTFDYDLHVSKPNSHHFESEYDQIFHDIVIMEVKFNGALPKWFHDIIEMYNLQKDVFSKYCQGIEACYGLPAYF